MVMNETDIAYIAGLIDGEAYMGIKKDKTMRNGRVNPCYQERICIQMVNEEAISFITSTLGGNYHSISNPKPNRRRLYCFQATDKSAARIIQTVLPYLKVKRAVANTVLELRTLREHPLKDAIRIKMINRWGKESEFIRYRFSQKHLDKCEILWQKCKNINHGIN
jgi:hypothetical protein